MRTFKVPLVLLIGALISLFASTCLLAQQEPLHQTINDEDIIVSHFEEMNYPTIARVSRREGVVVVQVKLSDTGNVVAAFAISGAKMLIPDVLNNARKWQFRPNALRVSVIIYQFQLAQGRCDSAHNGLFVFREPNIASVTSCVDIWQP